MIATSTFCLPITTIKDGPSLSHGQACRLSFVSGFTIDFYKVKAADRKPRRTLLQCGPWFSPPLHVTICQCYDWIPFPSGYVRAGLGKSRNCFLCCSVWLHCCTESGRGWTKCSMQKSSIKTRLTATTLFIADLFFKTFSVKGLYLSGYLDPRRQQQPFEPSWPGSPRSPGSTPRSTAGATGP